MRKEVLKIITDFEENKVFINLRLKQLNYSEQEMKNITIRVYGIIQNYDYLQFIVATITERNKIDAKTKRILLMASFEAIFLDSVPNYAIKSEYINLSKQINSKATKYVSYVLNNKLDNIEKIEPTFANETKNLSIKYSHPQWLVKKLQKQYPNNFEKILASNQEKKETTARVINKLLEPEKFNSFEYPDLVVSKENIIRSRDFKNDNLIIQDLGSYLVTLFVAPKYNENILDLCAAPGNKTMHIATNANMVVANELQENRFKLLQENFEKYDIKNACAINVDATNCEELDTNLPLKQFDKILIDAPCSCWGAIKSKPEMKYYQSLQDIENIKNIQKDILQTAIKYLSMDGELIYSTCTINKEENEMQIIKFLENNPEFEVVKNTELTKYETNEIGITLLPHQYNTDGFYMCKLKRKKK